VIEGSVNKKGIATRNGKICGDTLSILRGRKDLVIVGIGDPGKMDFYDSIEKGAPITTKALQEVLKEVLQGTSVLPYGFVPVASACSIRRK